MHVDNGGGYGTGGKEYTGNLCTFSSIWLNFEPKPALSKSIILKKHTKKIEHQARNTLFEKPCVYGEAGNGKDSIP